MAKSFENTIQKLMSVDEKEPVEKTENTSYYDNLVKAIDSEYYAYGLYSDAIAKFLRLGTEMYPFPQNEHLIQFLTSLHLHDIPLTDRKKIVLEGLKMHWNRTNP